MVEQEAHPGTRGKGQSIGDRIWAQRQISSSNEGIFEIHHYFLEIIQKENPNLIAESDDVQTNYGFLRRIAKCRAGAVNCNEPKDENRTSKGQAP